MSTQNDSPASNLRIAVAGGTGVVGAPTVAALRALGHTPVVLTRSTGVDLVTGAGLDAALEGVDAVIDTANTTTLSAKAAIAYFETATGNLARAGIRAGVGHLVVLSIVGVDRMPHEYYAGKVAQERVAEQSGLPVSIQRATQFHEFAAQLFENAHLGPLHLAPRARVQPMAAREVAAALAELAVGPPRGRVPDIAGPQEERLDAMIVAYARARGHRGWIPSVSLPGAQMKGMRAGLALPGPEATLGEQTFAQWLSDQAAGATTGNSASRAR